MDECLNEYIEILEYSLKILRELVSDIKAHHNRCNIVRTTRTTASVAGLMLITRCTSGASIVTLTGAGVAVGMIG